MKNLYIKNVFMFSVHYASGGVIGPCLFENTTGEGITIDGIQYLQMITDFLLT